MWEVDKPVLQQHALPSLAVYTYEASYLVNALQMDSHLPNPQQKPSLTARPADPVPRRMMRMQGTISKLAKIVGRSWQVCMHACMHA